MASLSRVPPKNSSLRICSPAVFGAGPGVISTVAGLNGTAVLTEPRVAITAQLSIATGATRTSLPIDARKVLVSGEPRTIHPFGLTTAMYDWLADRQITARWNGIPSVRPPPGFFVST